MIRRLKKDVSGGCWLTFAAGCAGERGSEGRGASPSGPGPLGGGSAETRAGCRRAAYRPARTPPPPSFQVLDQLPDKIRKRIPVEVDPAHK